MLGVLAAPRDGCVSPLKFLPGIIVGQAATAALVVAAMNSAENDHQAVLVAIALIIALMLALWFAALGEHIRKDALLAAKDEFARERERIIVSAEVDKRSMLEQTHQRIVAETRRAHSRANLKVGLALAGLAGIGALLLAIELVSFGLMTLSAAGGLLAGYVIRARQDGARRRLELREMKPGVMLEHKGKAGEKALPSKGSK